jgi:hypothetical protein
VTRLLQQWHIPRCQLTSGLTTSSLAGGEASASHLSLEQEECKIKFFKEPQKIGTRKNSFVIYMSLRASGLARLASYGQHGFDTTCHTLFQESRNEASIRVPRMFKSHLQQQYDKHVPCSIIQSNYLLHNDPWVWRKYITAAEKLCVA